MDATSRGYPYPQCLPELIKDAGDLPQQTLALAEAIGADLDALQSRANAALKPPFGVRRDTVGQVLNQNDVFVLATTVGGGAMAPATPNTRLIVQTAGLHLITGTCLGTVNSANFHGLQILHNGELLRRNLIRPGPAAALLRNNVITSAVLGVGDYLELAQDAGAGIATTYTRAELGAVLVAAL